MQYSTKLFLPLWLFAFSALGGQSLDLTVVTLTYGDSVISADIGPDSRFKVSNRNDTDHIEFSGTVTKTSHDYLVDVRVVVDKVASYGRRELNTTMLVENEQVDAPLVIGGVNEEVFSLTLRR
ncbi:hypothetical protein [Vibrio europaeus]|uniref:Uncharacterized protein n=1 Tax=Vibrio europaeus TaxID=300876 RepID=A0AAE7DY03_9VIBR|nr:hypothetical protein [Vibrio europaeus]MDC5819255.1 hypothetical protein [Vibrio europaeus]NOH22544.1 hypothetical protein [Vibrio europaeus]QJY38079.1 hypothetical protein HOO69_15980 [Vibrio europaeus]